MRSKLFVPASRPELFAKALASAADCISFDLEDAVAEEQKSSARQQLAAALASAEVAATTKIIIVRINAPTSPHFAADLQAVVHPRVDYLNLPKLTCAEEVHRASAEVASLEQARGFDRQLSFLANIETPRALRCAHAIACADPRVAGLQLAFGDLLEPLGIDRSNSAVIQQLQLAVRLAAGEAGIWAYDAAFGAIKDPEGFRAEALGAHRLGYLGKSCIHPSQIALANETFRPSSAEIEFARRVVTAAATQSGAFTVDGRMIDAPFIRRAHIVLAAANSAPA